MQKYADKYLKVDPWKVIEEGFEPAKSNVSESIFSLGNEYMGVRGYFEEGYSGDRFLGSYFNGVYELGDDAAALHYKGIVKQTHFMINSVDWLYTRISVDDELLDMAKSKIHGFERCLDLKTGILTRKLIWTTTLGKTLEVSFERFTSMASPKYGFQSIEIKPINFDGQVKLILGLDFNTIHKATGKNYWNCFDKSQKDGIYSILGGTALTKQKIFSAFKLLYDDAINCNETYSEKFIGSELNLELKNGISSKVYKMVFNYVDKRKESTEFEVWNKGIKLCGELSELNYETEREKHINYWDKVWSNFDITISGDPDNQQGIRYCIFQMHQTYHGEDPSLNIGAKGLTGEAYNGHTFWDTETYCLPFYIFNNPKAARNLLEYRYNTLPMALERAKQLDCIGACYPIATLNGNEACTLWQHASLQFQPSTAVAYGIFHYVKITNDLEFLYEKGCEMLIEICRFLAARGDWSSRSGEFGYYGVMGPDEFQMMVNNNCYTNFMAKKTFEYTVSVINRMETDTPEGFKKLCTKLNFSTKEAILWTNMAEKMRIPYEQSTGIYEQHDGYFNLPHIDINEISVDDFPLYNHWSYDRIYRNDMIKQPDVLMFMFLYSGDFSLQSKKINYEFYEPRCIHESSLSPSIHSIFAAELGKHEEAFDFFNFATRMDLDNYNRNSNEGLHTTSIAAAWVNIVYGFGGMRSDGGAIKINPTIPEKWDCYSFRILYSGSIIAINVTKEFVTLKVIEGPDTLVNVFGNNYNISKEGVYINISSSDKA